MPLGAVLFLVTMIAEVERVPFDMPEAEAELVEGWWTEYGGMRFGMLFMAEYIRTYAACFLFTHFFLGGWHLPFQGTISQIPVLGDAYVLIPGAIVVLLKTWLVFACRVCMGAFLFGPNTHRPNLRIWLENASASLRCASRSFRHLPVVFLQTRESQLC